MFLDRRVLVFALVAGLSIGFAWPAITERGVTPESGIYVVAVEDPSPLEDAVRGDPTFLIDATATRDDEDPPDLVLDRNDVLYDDASDKSAAAAHQLEMATRAWLNDRLGFEEDQDAAFPVRVNVVYQARDVAPAAVVTPGGPEPVADEPAPGESPPDGAGGTDGASAGGAGGQADSELLERSAEPETGLTPDELDPPFPLESLLLTFAYLIPLTFIAELYSGAVYAERTRRRGLLLLSAPVSARHIVLGKTIPYILMSLAIAITTTIWIGSGVVGFLAVLPVIGFTLAAALVIAIVAPSQRGLTFLLVSVIVLLSTFLFLPAMFTEVDPVAFLSPVGVIAASIRGEAVTLGPFLYATLPMTTAATVLAGVAMPLYKEETLFAPRPVFSKMVDAVGALVRRKRNLVIAGALAVPFALGLELFILIFAVTLDLRTAFVMFVLGAAAVEEALKGLSAYANANRGGGPTHAPWIVGGLVGLGFFLGEKSALALSVFGFGLLPQGSEALTTFGIAASPLLVLAPLVLHATTTSITASFARRGRESALVGWLLASVVHAAYNGAVIFGGLGGGFP